MTLRPARRACEREREAARMRLLPLTGWAVLAGLLWLGAALVYHATRPVLGPATVVVPGQAVREVEYPLRWTGAPVTRFVLRQTFWLPAWHASVFVFYPRDILWAVAVNGREVRAAGLPISAASEEGRAIDLGPYLHPGLNVMELKMEVCWGEARLRMAVSPLDPCALMTLALSVAASGASAALLAGFFRVRLLWPEWLVLLGGIGLRLLYFSATPYYVRSFDYWGHTDYLDYVVEHLGLPQADANWESFQPPLYYLLLGTCTRVFLALGMAGEERYVFWQGASLLLSIGVLIAGYALAFTLYRECCVKRFSMLAALAVAPPLVFNATRISNDSLAAMLAFVWLFLLVRFSQREDKQTWLWLSVTVGLALLTKATALAFVAISIFYIIIYGGISMSWRLGLLAWLLAICAVMSGGYYFTRLLHVQTAGSYLVGNLDSLQPRARITDVFEKSMVFNPLKVICYPFDEPWGPRNDRFLEVFFKTLLLGEWIKGEAYKWLARFMVVNALLLVPAFLVGVYHGAKVKARAARPVALTLVGVFLAQWFFLQAAPFLPSQDFRFSVILIVPLVFYLLEGVDFFSARARAVMTFLLQLAVLNEAVYLVSLALAD